MNEYSVPIEGDALKALSESFKAGPIIEYQGRELHYLIEYAVARLGALKLEVFSNEHPPPHFRVKYQGFTANFSISDGEPINGDEQVLRYRKNVKNWWKDNKQLLIETWNERRPSDCTVGEYRE